MLATNSPSTISASLRSLAALSSSLVRRYQRRKRKTHAVVPHQDFIAVDACFHPRKLAHRRIDLFVSDFGEIARQNGDLLRRECASVTANRAFATALNVKGVPKDSFRLGLLHRANYRVLDRSGRC
jgi:hypothetical protein